MSKLWDQNPEIWRLHVYLSQNSHTDVLTAGFIYQSVQLFRGKWPKGKQNRSVPGWYTTPPCNKDMQKGLCGFRNWMDGFKTPSIYTENLRCYHSFSGFWRQTHSQLLVMGNEICAGLIRKKKDIWIHVWLYKTDVVNFMENIFGQFKRGSENARKKKKEKELKCLLTKIYQLLAKFQVLSISSPRTSYWPQQGPPLSCAVFQRCI